MPILPASRGIRCSAGFFVEVRVRGWAVIRIQTRRCFWNACIVGEEEVVHLSSLNAGDRAGLQGGTAVLAAGLGHHGAPGVPSLSFSEGMVSSRLGIEVDFYS